MKPISVFIDTSSLPRNPAHPGLGFERICQLAQSNLAQVYLSEIVKREWFSQFLADWEDCLKTAQKAIRQVVVHPWSTGLGEFSSLEKAYSILDMEPLLIQVIAERNFKNLLEELQAKLLLVHGKHANRVIEKYFGGYPPFGSKKNREDFPDAFIFESAVDLARSIEDDLHCIIGDNRLRTSLSRLNNIHVYQSLDEFVKTKIIKEMTLTLEPERLWNASVTTVMRSLPKMEKEITDQIESILLDNVVSTSIFDTGIPDDNNEAYVSGIYDPENVSLKWKELSSFGPGLLSLPFELCADAEIEFFVFKGDSVPDGVWVQGADPETDHYYDAGGRVTLEIQGKLALHIDPFHLPEDGAPQLLKVSLHKIDNIDVQEQEFGSIFLVYEDDLEY